MELTKKRKIIYYMVLIAMFSALSFVGTYVSIPIGISKMHLGNLFSIIGGLLCGGLVGGISGALGMGLNDIFSGYGPDTIIRTFVVKFIVGFFAGFIFRTFVKKEKKINHILISLFLISFALFVSSLILFIVNGEKTIIGSITLKNSIVLVIFSGCMSLFYLFSFLLSNRIKAIQKYVLTATSLACSINIILEFAFKIPLKMMFLSWNFEKALIYATSSLPSAILTSLITTAVITAIYFPVYHATKSINKLDNLNSYIQEITSFEAEKNK